MERCLCGFGTSGDHPPVPIGGFEPGRSIEGLASAELLNDAAYPRRRDLSRIRTSLANPSTCILAVDGIPPDPAPPEGFHVVQEIKPDQRWHQGLDEVQVIKVFGVRIVIRPHGTNVDEEITENVFRGRYRFVADH